MFTTRTLLALSLVIAPVLVGCSHDDDTQHDHTTAARTSGDEHHAPATHPAEHHAPADTVATSESEPTAMDQGESAADIEITRQIRSAVIADSSLSFGARNCVIITNGGNVTLRGDATTAESAAIERHALGAAGVLHVTNDLHTTDQASSH